VARFTVPLCKRITYICICYGLIIFTLFPFVSIIFFALFYNFSCCNQINVLNRAIS
jgi:hypothetical protein